MHATSLLVIAAGGALGALARHAVNHLAQLHWSSRIGVGTVAVNLAGCFLIGVLAGLLARQQIALTQHWREFIFVGLLGGFTTFSTFGLDAFLLVRTHSAWAAGWYVGSQVVGGLAAVALGYAVSRM